MRDTFVRTLIKIAKNNKNVLLITGDLGFGVLKPYFEAVPDQFINAGIAEQNMTSAAAGMALEGKIVFTYSIGNFPTFRCLEQIRNDCAYQNANVKIVCVGGGFVYGSLGMSHQATEDIAVMRALPGVTVVCPGDFAETEEATKAITDLPGTVYLRLGRENERAVNGKIKNFKIGKAIKIRDAVSASNRIAVFSTGDILNETAQACDILENEGTGVEQYSFHTVKPIDKEVILSCAEKYGFIVSVEENNINGGFGSAVSEVLTDAGKAVKLLRIGLDDTYCTVAGDQNYLREKYGMKSRQIADRIHTDLQLN